MKTPEILPPNMHVLLRDVNQEQSQGDKLATLSDKLKAVGAKAVDQTLSILGWEPKKVINGFNVKLGEVNNKKQTYIIDILINVF